jgi:hypothetical protein
MTLQPVDVATFSSYFISLYCEKHTTFIKTLVPYPMGTGGSFLGGKRAGARS